MLTFDEIIHRGKDRYGDIIVAEKNGKRSLCFGNTIRQSCMLPDSPETLVLEYTKAMMFALIFGPQAKSALFVGLGGGSMVKFLQHVCPKCRIDAVEMRKQVIDAANRFFRLPKPNSLFQIIHAEGQDFLASEESKNKQYDLLFVDAFNEFGPDSVVREIDFLAGCRKKLSVDGIFTINLWTRKESNFPWTYSMLSTVFSGNTLKLHLTGESKNAIVYGFNNPSSMKDRKHWRERAKNLQALSQINFQRFLRHLLWQNHPVTRHFFK